MGQVLMWSHKMVSCAYNCPGRAEGLVCTYEMRLVDWILIHYSHRDLLSPPIPQLVSERGHDKCPR